MGTTCARRSGSNAGAPRGRLRGAAAYRREESRQKRAGTGGGVGAALPPDAPPHVRGRGATRRGGAGRAETQDRTLVGLETRGQPPRLTAQAAEAAPTGRDSRWDADNVKRETLSVSDSGVQPGRAGGSRVWDRTTAMPGRRRWAAGRTRPADPGSGALQRSAKGKAGGRTRSAGRQPGEAAPRAHGGFQRRGLQV